MMFEFGHPTHRDIRDLAHQLWISAGQPSADQISPDYFWSEAECKLTPTIVLAISQELRQLGIIRKPGDGFFADFYCCGEETPPYCYGTLHDNGIYEVRHSSGGLHMFLEFDLNRETDLTDLIEHLKSSAAEYLRLAVTAEVNLQPSWQTTLVGNQCTQTAKE